MEDPTLFPMKNPLTVPESAAAQTERRFVRPRVRFRPSRLFNTVMFSVVVGMFVTGEATAAAINVSPAETPSTTEIVNPMRGYFRWRGSWTVPQPSVAVDHYDRFFWTDLEGSTQGSYDMQPIYNGIATAKSIGGPKAKFALRIRCMPGASESGTRVPLYVRNLMPKGWMNGSAYVPDWNDSDFIARYNALIARVAQEFDGSPDIAYLDIGTYGCWGEWHTSGLSYPRSTPGGTADKATTATLQAYVDGYANAFSQTRLVMMTDNETALVYAMGKVPSGSTPWIGWRRDSLANTHFDTGMTTAKQNAVANRWQKAPVVTETFGGSGVTPSLIPGQVQNWHVAALGNGNINAWSTYSSTNQNHFLNAGRLMGYRFVLTNLNVAQALQPGGAFTVACSWKNVGVTPHYEPFTVKYQLRNGSTVVWEGDSSLDLEGFLPTGSTPSAVNDAFTLPTSVAPGTYSFVVFVPSLDGSRDPLKLAITTTPNSDGSYPLGNVIVASAYVASIDDFEDGNVSAPTQWVSMVGSGPAVAMSATTVSGSEPAAHAGSLYHATIDFGSTATWKYAVLNRGTAVFGGPWSANAVNAIRFYLKSSSVNPASIANNAIKVQLREGDTGDRWSFDLGNAVQNDDPLFPWTLITVPLGSFYGESSNAPGATLTLSAIDQIRFFDNAVAAQVKMRVDRIEAVVQ